MSFAILMVYKFMRNKTKYFARNGIAFYPSNERKGYFTEKGHFPA